MLALNNDSTRNKNLSLPFLRRSWNEKERQERQRKTQRLTQRQGYREKDRDRGRDRDMAGWEGSEREIVYEAVQHDSRAFWQLCDWEVNFLGLLLQRLSQLNVHYHTACLYLEIV